MGLTREILDLVADLRRFAEHVHDAAPAGVMAAVSAVVNVRNDVRAFMEEGGIPVEFPTGMQKPGVEDDPPIVGIGDTGLGLGSPAGLDTAVEADLISLA